MLNEVDDGGPDHPERDRRIPWAELLRRTHLLDLTVCPNCRGPMRVVSVIFNERVAQSILAHLGLKRAPPTPLRGQTRFAFADHDGVDAIPEE